jgi:hypothetical protein
MTSSGNYLAFIGKIYLWFSFCTFFIFPFVILLLQLALKINIDENAAIYITIAGSIIGFIAGLIHGILVIVEEYHRAKNLIDILFNSFLPFFISLLIGVPGGGLGFVLSFFIAKAMLFVWPIWLGIIVICFLFYFIKYKILKL